MTHQETYPRFFELAQGGVELMSQLLASWR